MNKIKKFMLEYPLISVVLILPFCLVFVFAVVDLITNIIIPFVFALWIAGWIYGVVVGFSTMRFISDPFWYTRSQRF